MDHFKTSLRDIRFTLFEQVKVQELTNYEKFNEFTQEDFDMIISEALKLAQEVIAPLNEVADKVGCRYENDKVYVPEEYHNAYKLYTELGWHNLTVNPDFGGQGLPQSIGFAADEMFTGACNAFAAFRLLTNGAAHLVESFGTPEMKEKYCEKMYSGEWGGTMCLTEPDAGSDVGNVKTVARKNGDHYLITGNKIFISNGEHNLTENIIHLLLARIEGAPAGTKGLSLFLIPKILVNGDGSLGEPNDIVCTKIEHKMGFHGSPTCALSFGENDKCIGYLVGKENEGIRLMFQMMNEARIGVGLQGVAIGSTAYYNALKYATERIQGTPVENPKAPRIPIINHPDIRRMLMTMKSYVEGTRSLLYLCGYFINMKDLHPDPTQREKFSNLIEVLTPVCKAYSTDMGVRVADMAFRIYGGYGYMQEYPIQQYLKESFIATIYEGTNTIQALDLIGRKVPMKNGAAFNTVIEMLKNFVNQNKNHEILGEYIGLLEKAINTLVETTMFLGKLGMKENIRHAVLYSAPYLEMFGDIINAYLLLDQAVIASEKLKDVDKSHPDHNFYSGKVYTAKFFVKNILPKVYSTAETIKNKDKSALDIPEEILTFGV